jgi:hypothetical protein
LIFLRSLGCEINQAFMDDLNENIITILKLNYLPVLVLLESEKISNKFFNLEKMKNFKNYFRINDPDLKLRKMFKVNSDDSFLTEINFKNGKL